jgi:DNA-binding CsgD family transcriptional regulator
MSTAQQLAKHVSKHDLASTLDLVEAANQVGTEQQFAGLLRQLCNVLPAACADASVAEIGADSSILRTSRRVSVNYPAQWPAVYQRRNFQRVDPVVRRLFVEQRPLYWSELRRGERTPAQEEFYAMAADFGLQDGVSFGTRFDRSTNGSFFTVAGPGLGRDLRHRKLFDYLAPHLHVALTRVHLGQQRDQPRLTPRELEVLRWAKYGKTNWEISRLLVVSPRAVKFHLENAMRKLDVVNRTQAIAVALSLGLIQWS